jgi:hypothetical protein
MQIKYSHLSAREHVAYRTVTQPHGCWVAEALTALHPVLLRLELVHGKEVQSLQL